MKKVILILTLLLINACNEEKPIEPTENEIGEPVYTDTLSREIIEDVFLFVDSLKDNYTLDEYVLANVHLKNENNISGLPIYIGSWPPYLIWRFESLSGDLVALGPLSIGLVVYDDTLQIGEEIIEDINWNHFLYDENEMYNELKAYSGDYVLKIIFRGIDFTNTPHLIKYFSISEFGDPISCHLFKDYDSEDTVKVDFVMRNRINSKLTFNTTNDSCGIYLIERNYNQSPDTVFAQKFLLEQQVYNLPPKSDNVLYKFRYAEQDLINQGITGAFDIVIKLNFVERIIISSNLIFIL